MKYIQSKPSRLWFLSKGCRLVPQTEAHGYIRWAHPDGYFLKPDGRKATDNYSPASQGANPNTKGGDYPQLRECRKKCHILVALAFYEPRPTYIDRNGKPYPGICHHLVPDRRNYRPDNLLAWLTREQHSEADRRQRALKAVVPNGNLYCFSYDRLRYLQDPRTLSASEFQHQLALIRDQGFHISSFDQMEYEMTHHMEI